MTEQKKTWGLWLKRWLLAGFVPVAFGLYLAWASAQSDLVIRDTALWRTDKGVAVVGTLLNRTARPMPSLNIEVRFFSSSHEKIGEALAAVQPLSPRESARFATEGIFLPDAANYQVTLPVFRTPYGN